MVSNKHHPTNKEPEKISSRNYSIRSIVKKMSQAKNTSQLIQFNFWHFKKRPLYLQRLLKKGPKNDPIP
jgi:hypothetical protein